MMRTALSGLGRRSRLAIATAVAASVLMVPAQARAQNAQASFDRAKALEEQLGDSPTVEAIRRAAKAYEAVPYRYPNSGLCDNALWQEAALFERAFEKSSDAKDRADAAKALEWLAKEYPASPMVKQASARAAALRVTPSEEPVAQAPPPPPAATQNTIVRSITRTPLPKGDRVTMELTAEVAFTGERVANPDRIFFDFPKTGMAIALAEQIKALQSPLIKAVRVGRPAAGVTRVVIELVGAPTYSTFSLYGPFRVVVDLESTATNVASTPPPPAATSAPMPSASPSPSPSPTSSPSPVPPAPPMLTPLPTTKPTPSPMAAASTLNQASSSNEGQPVAPASNRKGDYSLSRQLGLRVSKIVIDPGHGGHDPGAMANGITESELVLDVALRLEKLLLQTPGVEVVLTRRTNEFVPLEERTAIANRERADLFLSIHANSHNQSAVRGVESYFLNFATNPEAEAVAARENAASAGRMGTLPAIVKAITLNDKVEESRELATLLQNSLVKGTRTQPGGSRDLGVKQAPFVVLIGAEMPSVLTEIGFLTNKSEAANIKTPAQRQLIAQSLRDAIVRYQASLKKVTVPAPQTRRE